MDDRLSQQASQINNPYDSLIQESSDLYARQNSFADEYERTQNEALDKQLAFQEKLINQNKEKAREVKETEEKKAKNDYFSYINPYGVQAESFASQGLLNTGVSETAKLGGYNTYQNRVATANKVMQEAFVQYDNELEQARLNNDVQKAQNALNKLQMQLEYSENYYNRRSDLAQQNLQYNQWQQQFDYQKQRDAVADAQWQKEYNLSKSKAKTISSGGGSGLTKLSDGGGSVDLSGNVTNNGQKLKASYSANKWLADQMGFKYSDGITIDELSSLIAKGLSEGKLTDSEVKSIYKSYGLS